MAVCADDADGEAAQAPLSLESLRGRDFIQRVTEFGRERKVQVRVDAKRGKDSHVTLYYGDRKTVVKNRRKEVGPGLQEADT